MLKVPSRQKNGTAALTKAVILVSSLQLRLKYLELTALGWWTFARNQVPTSIVGRAQGQ